MCGICSTTGVNLLPSNDYIGGKNVTGGLVPQVTSDTQIVVYGPDYTGPRQTVVDTSQPKTWPAWISAVNGVPTDSGAPGGTFQAQQLPTLSVTGYSWWWVPLLLLGLLVVVKARRQ